MKGIATIGALALCTQLSGCFVFIPGSAIAAVSDGVTGSKGEHCVSRAAKIGDKVKDPYSNRVYTVVSLSGTSSRCNNADIPIRAELALEAQSMPAAYTPPAPSQATPEERNATCQKLRDMKPGAPFEEWQAITADMRRVGVTYDECKPKKT